jgi:hypothetical protein
MSRRFIPDFNYIPDNLSVINNNTPLCKGIRLGHFLKDATLGNCTIVEKKQIVRNLLPQAVIYRSLKSHKILNGYSFRIAEGIYTAERDEDLSNKEFLLKQSQGLIVTYEVERNGSIDIEKSISVIEHMKIFHLFGKVSLAIDQLNTKTNHAQIVVEMPVIPESYVVLFPRDVITTYNNNLISSNNEIVEPR